MSAPDVAGVSIREFARLSGCNEKQVRRAIESGRLSRLPSGALDPAQLSTEWRKPTRRSGPALADSADTADKSADITPMSAPAALPGESPAEAAERIVLALGPAMDLNEAVRVKENYTALLKRLEYDIKSGAVVEASVVGKAVSGEYAKVRTKLLAIPAEQAPSLFRCKTVPELQDRLLVLITRTLEELSLDGERSAG